MTLSPRGRKWIRTASRPSSSAGSANEQAPTIGHMIIFPPRTNQQKQTERKVMNNEFDELTKAMAQSITRRAALKHFGVSVAGMALACFGLTNGAHAAKGTIPQWCDQTTNLCCCKKCHTYLPPDDINWWNCESACRLAC